MGEGVGIVLERVGTRKRPWTCQVWWFFGANRWWDILQELDKVSSFFKIKKIKSLSRYWIFLFKFLVFFRIFVIVFLGVSSSAFLLPFSLQLSLQNRNPSLYYLISNRSFSSVSSCTNLQKLSIFWTQSGLSLHSSSKFVQRIVDLAVFTVRTASLLLYRYQKFFLNQ